MTKSELVRLIGFSHLLQLPLTLLLSSSRGLALRAALSPRSSLMAGVVHNMAVASVGLPTALGLLLAGYAHEALQQGPARTMALLVSSFWCWRLYRQLFVLGPLWPACRQGMAIVHAALLAIFTAQGPGLAILILG